MQDVVLMKTDFQEAELLKRGKVRDIYVERDKLLIVATDRISAFDVILPEGIPGKGRALNRISEYWFAQTEDIIQNHLISTDVDAYPEVFHKYRPLLEGRSMLVRKTAPLAVECVVRGYVAGSGWREYQESCSICSIPLPKGLVESAKLDTPIFTPSTKARDGEHDENISFDEVVELIGQGLACKVREASIALYLKAKDIAGRKGIIIADTKFEFGIDVETGGLILIDEALTPDSSRFWPADEYSPGGSQPSFDKQFVRDYLITVGWDKNPPAPSLPKGVVEKSSEKYEEMLKHLLG